MVPSQSNQMVKINKIKKNGECGFNYTDTYLRKNI